MNNLTRHFAPAVIAAASVFGASCMSAAAWDRYVVTPLVSDLPGRATNKDPVLQNAWGVCVFARRQSFLDRR